MQIKDSIQHLGIVVPFQQFASFILDGLSIVFKRDLCFNLDVHFFFLVVRTFFFAPHAPPNGQSLLVSVLIA